MEYEVIPIIVTIVVTNGRQPIIDDTRNTISPVPPAPTIEPQVTPSTSLVQQPAIQSPTAIPSARKRPKRNEDRIEAIDETLSSIFNF